MSEADCVCRSHFVRFRGFKRHAMCGCVLDTWNGIFSIFSPNPKCVFLSLDVVVGGWCDDGWLADWLAGWLVTANFVSGLTT